MDNFKFNFLSRGQLESLSLDKFQLAGFKTITCHEVFFGNSIFAIIARMLCGNHLNKRTRICTFVRLSQVNKFRVSALELRQVRFGREIKRRMKGRVSFLQGGHLFHFSSIPCRALTAFSSFQCWLNS